MNNSRIAILKQYIEEEPEEPFNFYALATEYIREEPSTALQYFELLLERHPDYLGTYYHAGKLYFDLNQTEKAKQVLEKGIQLALVQKQNKALSELRNALNEILDEEDEY